LTISNYPEAVIMEHFKKGQHTPDGQHRIPVNLRMLASMI